MGSGRVQLVTKGTSHALLAYWRELNRQEATGGGYQAIQQRLEAERIARWDAWMAEDEDRDPREDEDR